MRYLRPAALILLVLCAAPAPAHTGDVPTTLPAAGLRGELLPVNVRHMLWGYCHAGSKVPDTDAPGGYWASDNFPTEFQPKDRLHAGEVYLTVDPAAEVAFAGKYRGITLRLVNATKQRAAFRASDSRLSIVQEARDADGQWREIEYLPQSWCGNSYHRVFLEPGQCWTFAAARYEGTMKTKLRFKLTGEHGAIYSEELDGSINPEQFTIQHAPASGDLMDPYSK